MRPQFTCSTGHTNKTGSAQGHSQGPEIGQFSCLIRLEESHLLLERIVCLVPFLKGATSQVLRVSLGVKMRNELLIMQPVRSPKDQFNPPTAFLLYDSHPNVKGKTVLTPPGKVL